MLRYIAPRRENDNWPYLLREAAMLGMVFLVILSFITANIQALIWVNIDWMVSTILPAVIVTKTNGERAEGNVGSLTRSSVLDRAAQLKAEDMAQEGYFAHYSPSGVSPWHWFNEAGYAYVHAGENLAVHFNDSSQVVEAWMDSPTHRANIMNGNFTEIGIGVAEGTYEGYDTVFVVQMFGTPSGVAAPAPRAAAAAPVVSEPESELAEVAATPAASATVAAAADEEAPAETAEVVPVAFADLIAATPVEPELELPREPTTTEAVPEVDERPTTTATFLATTSRASTDSTPPSLFAWFSMPFATLQYFYAAIAGVVALALTASLLSEWRRHHALQVAYSGGLLALMVGLLYLQTFLTGAVSIA